MLTYKSLVDLRSAKKQPWPVLRGVRVTTGANRPGIRGTGPKRRRRSGADEPGGSCGVVKQARVETKRAVQHEASLSKKKQAEIQSLKA